MREYPNRDRFLEHICNHQHQYYRLAYSFMGNEADSMDAISQLSLTVIEKGHTVREVEAFPAWSKKVLVNICRSELKRRKRREIPIEEPYQNAVPVTYNPNIEDNMVLQAALGRLPEKYREILVLRYFLDYEYKEIAQTLSLAEGTVKSRIHRAMEQIKKEIAKEMEEGA